MKDFTSYSKSKGEINYTNSPLIPSGFIYLDYMNGRRHVAYDENENPITSYDSVGFIPGSIISLIGKSASGKTTFAMHVAQSMVHPFVSKVLQKTIVEEEIDTYPVIEVYDVENKFDIALVKRTMQYPNSLMKKMVTVHRDKTDVDIVNRMEKHIEYKKQFMKRVKYKFKDIYGDNFTQYPPSVIVLDSLNQIESSRINTFDDMVGNTAGLARAKSIQNVLNRMSEISYQYNITFIVIQHILLDANLGVTPKAKAYLGLKKDEKLVAGEKGTLLSTNIIRLEHESFIGEKSLGGKAKVYEKSFGEDVDGFIVKCTIVKSTSSVLGRQCRLVCVGQNGFNHLMSTFYEACQRGHIERKGNFYYIPGVEGRLNNRNFLERVSEDFSIAEKMYKHILPKLQRFITGEKAKEGEETEEDIQREFRSDFFNLEDDE